MEIEPPTGAWRDETLYCLMYVQLSSRPSIATTPRPAPAPRHWSTTVVFDVAFAITTKLADPSQCVFPSVESACMNTVYGIVLTGIPETNVVAWVVLVTSMVPLIIAMPLPVTL